MKVINFYNKVTPFISMLTEESKLKVISSLNEIKAITETAPASKRTHYHKLNEFSDPVYNSIRKQLYATGFVNGNPEANRDNAEMQIIWFLYGEMGSISYRIPFEDLNGVAAHHASAYDRKKAFLRIIEELKALII